MIFIDLTLSLASTQVGALPRRGQNSRGAARRSGPAWAG
jgi:hypothetical protein